MVDSMLVTLKLRECKHFQYLINCTETTYFRENDILVIFSLDDKSRYEFMQFTLNKTALLSALIQSENLVLSFSQ